MTPLGEIKRVARSKEQENFLDLKRLYFMGDKFRNTCITILLPLTTCPLPL